MLPFIEAFEKMKTFYKNKRLDLFKAGVSLPGLVTIYLIKGTESEFSLFDEEDKVTKEDRKRNNTPQRVFQQFADEVSDARRTGDIDKAYELLAETMQLFRNSA